MADETEPSDERRHAELVDKHVYGDPKRRPQQGRAPWFKATSAASIGIEIAVAVAGCTLVAMWLQNNYTHWEPWTMLIGLGIGIGAAVKALVRTAKQFQAEIAEREAREREQGRAQEQAPGVDGD